MLDRSHFYLNLNDSIATAVLKLEPPPEPTFNCFDCAMTPAGWNQSGTDLSRRTRDLGPFRPSLKCCTYSPFLPSFVIGALFERSELPESLDLKKRLSQYFERVQLTPLGAIPHQEPTSICETGRKESARCDFLERTENPSCTIFNFRPSPCLSYVCRAPAATDPHQPGQFFNRWAEWGGHLKNIEWTLAHLTALEAGYLPAEVETPFLDRDAAMSYYLRCINYVRRLNGNDLW